mgnify:CR=1 FL=1
MRLEETSEGFFVLVDGRRFAVPSPLRWKLYRRGWKARLDQLEREYGVGRHVALGPDSVVLDIGANAGEFAHVCTRYRARALCFEPDPDAFRCLKENVAALDGIAVFDDVVWEADGEVDFGLAPARADSSVFAEGPKLRKRSVTIETIAREQALSRVALLKCDAEGAEPEVLAGIGAAFSIIRTIALDTGPERMGERTNDPCASILRANGFAVFEERVGTRFMTYGVRKDP